MPCKVSRNIAPMEFSCDKLALRAAISLTVSSAAVSSMGGVVRFGNPLAHARLMATMQAAPNYRFYALPDGKRPGLIQRENDGAAIACEVWEMRAAHFGSFVAGITAPLGIGKLELADETGHYGLRRVAGVADRAWKMNSMTPFDPQQSVIAYSSNDRSSSV